MNRHVGNPGSWSVAEAKARLSEVIDRARAGVPQRITRRGADAVVVVSAEEWARLNPSAPGVAEEPRGSILELFEPIRGSGLHETVERFEGDFRDPGFDRSE